jgi:spermidine synthase
VIADTYSFGRMLVLDGGVQSTEDDESLYHEVLVQPAMLVHPDPQEVLIIGGGEGATLREVLAHASVKRATMVDLDREAVDLCRAHLPTWHRGAFEDPRARLVFDDGRHYVESAEEMFDVAIIDVVDMLDNGPAQALYTRQFYARLQQRMRPGGVVVVQGLEFSFLDHAEHVALLRTLRTVFRHVASYSCAVPSFLSQWGFLIASDSIDPGDFSAASIDRLIDRKLGPDWLDHLTGEFFVGCQCYDKDTRLLLSLPGPILEDGKPFVAPPDIADSAPLTARLPVLGRS